MPEAKSKKVNNSNFDPMSKVSFSHVVGQRTNICKHKCNMGCFLIVRLLSGMQQDGKHEPITADTPGDHAYMGNHVTSGIRRTNF